MSNNFPPKVTALPAVVGIEGTISFFSMIRTSDPDGNPIVEYRVRDNGRGANSGSFSLDGDFLTPGVWHELTPLEAQRLIYVGGLEKARESYSVTVDDGFFRSGISGNDITTGNSRPTITGIETRVNAREEVLASTLFNYNDVDGDKLTRAWFIDYKAGDDTGHWELGGVEQPAGRFFTATPFQLPSLKWVGGKFGRQSEFVGAQVYDGVSISSVSRWLMVTSGAPNLVAKNASVLADESIEASRLFNAKDPDGDPITRYQFVDRLANARGGYFRLDGVRLPSAKWFTIDADELVNLEYIGGAFSPQVENLGIRAYDGAWSQTLETSIRTTSRPVATGTDQSILEAYSFSMEGVISGFDTDGDSIEAFRIIDARVNENGGYFEFKGTRLPSGTYFDVDVGELNELRYVGGAYGPQTEDIRFQVRAAGIWGALKTLKFTTLENEFRPVVNAFDVNSRLGTVIDAQTMFKWSDEDGDPTVIKRVGFYDTGEEADSGFFTVNGIVQAAEAWFVVDYETVLSGVVQYHLSDRADDELYRIFVNDGRFASAVDTGRIRAIPTPVLATNDNDISLDTIERVDVSNFFTQVDDGPAYIQYEIYDENTDSRSGRFELDGVDLQQGIVHTLDAAQFSRLVYKGAEADFGRQLDPILIRADNGITGKSEWIRINVNTDPVGNDALTSGTRFNNTTGTPVTEVTYTFIDGGNQEGNGTRDPMNYAPNSPPIPDYYTPDDDFCDLPSLTCLPGLGTLAWSQEMRESARVALANIETYANIKFTEIAYELDTQAQITFGSWGQFDSAVAGAAAYTTLPVDGSGANNLIGDIWFDSTIWDPRGPNDVGLGSAFHSTVLHEVGHTVGFKHPFEGDPTLSIFNNFDYLTQMAYQHYNTFSQFDEAYREQPSTFSLYDAVELQRIYGVNPNYNTENNQYIFNEPHQQLIYDAGGIDTLNLTNQTFGLKIDIREGQWTDLEGMVLNGMGDLELGAWKNSINIAYGTVIENARGGKGDDTMFGNEISNILFGNAGNDVLRANGGNDLMRGGIGNDTYIWSLGDGRDRIIDIGSTIPIDPDTPLGRKGDRVEFYDRTGQLNNLQDDLTFRRFGNDLRIDLTLNQGEGQGTFVISNYSGFNRAVETLAIYGRDGAQIGNDIDLTTIFPLATTAPQNFVETAANGDFGKVAALA